MELYTEDAPYLANQLCARYQGRTLAKVVCDSISPEDVRLTTLEVVVPRIVLAEFNTHRVFSRNSASSRAIPIEKMLKRVKEDPYIPETWGKNGRGMQAEEALDEIASEQAKCFWLSARDAAAEHVRGLLELGVHKQITNRLLEPFMWHTIIVTATEWSNFRHLRAHADAHPAIQNTAKAVVAVLDAHDPSELEMREWHLPFIHARDLSELAGMARAEPWGIQLAMLSSARCARVSYLTHDGIRELRKDFDLHHRLLSGGHMSPFEHPAFVDPGKFEGQPSNFAEPWIQYRKTISYEHDVYADPERHWEPAA